MTADEEEQRLEDRLRNWGRYIRNTHAVGKTTCTALDLSTEEVCEEVSPPEYQPPIDVRDAEKIETAWQAMPWHHEEYRAQKGILALIYANPNRAFGYYQHCLFRIYKVRLRFRDYEEIVKKAKKSLNRILRRLDNTLDAV